jgi:hypothetical protein
MESHCIVLLHGLLANSFTLKLYANHFTNAGYSVYNIDYYSRKHSFKEICELSILPVLKNCTQYKRISIVTHSMGGIVARYLLGNYQIKNLYRLVMISPPNHGSELVELFIKYKLLQKLLGRNWVELNTNSNLISNLPLPMAETGVIIGNKPIYPLSYKLPPENDGMVSIDSARLNNMKDLLILPCNHITILWNKQAIEQARYFIEHGYFMAL